MPRLWERPAKCPVLLQSPAAHTFTQVPMSDLKNLRRDKKKLTHIIKRSLNEKHSPTDEQLNEFLTDTLNKKSDLEVIFEANASGKATVADDKVRNLYKAFRTRSAAAAKKQQDDKGKWGDGKTSKKSSTQFASRSLPQGGTVSGWGKRLEESWAEKEPGNDNRMAFQSSGKPAPRLSLDQSTKEGQGWHMARAADFSDLMHRFFLTTQPVALIFPATSPTAGKEIEAAIARHATACGVAKKPAIKKDDLILKCSKTMKCDKDKSPVVIVNMNPDKLILPPHCVEFSGMAEETRPSRVPNLCISRPPETEIAVCVIRPMCSELGLDNWWQQLSAAPQKKLKAQLTNCIAKNKWQPEEPWLIKSKFLKWRGDDIEEGRIKAVFKVPNERVAEVLALSGREGLTIDKNRRKTEVDDDKGEDEFAKVKLPVDSGLQDILSRVEALPMELRKLTRGLIPTYKGYALRVERNAEAQITAALNPKEAAILGPALGLHATSQWVVKGVPHYATKSQIIFTLAQAIQGSWPGWTVRPTKTMAVTKSGTTTWRVEAANAPPLKAITLNNRLITIEAYCEKPAAATKNTPFRIVPKAEQHEISPGDIYDREYLEEDADSDEEDETKPMEVDMARKQLDEQQPSQQQANAAAQSSGSNQAPKADKDAALVAMMTTQAALIESLHATIRELQAEVAKLRQEKADSDI